MKIPTSIRIKGKRWSIKHKWNLKDEGHNGCDGLCDYDNQIIYLDRSLDKKDKEATLLHEIFHAIIFEVGLHQTSLEDDIEELIVENLSMFMLDTFNIRLKR